MTTIQVDVNVPEDFVLWVCEHTDMSQHAVLDWIKERVRCGRWFRNDYFPVVQKNTRELKMVPHRYLETFNAGQFKGTYFVWGKPLYEVSE
jgi:hypothetical protein